MLRTPLGPAHEYLAEFGDPGAVDPDFSAKNPGPHGTRLTSIIRLLPPVVDVSLLGRQAKRLCG